MYFTNQDELIWSNFSDSAFAKWKGTKDTQMAQLPQKLINAIDKKLDVYTPAAGGSYTYSESTAGKYNRTVRPGYTKMEDMNGYVESGYLRAYQKYSKYTDNYEKYERYTEAPTPYTKYVENAGTYGQYSRNVYREANCYTKYQQAPVYEQADCYTKYAQYGKAPAYQEYQKYSKGENPGPPKAAIAPNTVQGPVGFNQIGVNYGVNYNVSYDENHQRTIEEDLQLQGAQIRAIGPRGISGGQNCDCYSRGYSNNYDGRPKDCDCAYTKYTKYNKAYQKAAPYQKYAEYVRKAPYNDAPYEKYTDRYRDSDCAYQQYTNNNCYTQYTQNSGYTEQTAFYQKNWKTITGYTPCTPEVFGIQDNREFRTNFVIGVHSYDEDSSKEFVKYTVIIRKDGEPFSRVLLNESNVDNVRVKLDDLKGDGTYIITVQAFNDPYASPTLTQKFSSDIKSVRVKIRQNSELSDLKVTNESEYLDMTFGPEGISSNKGTWDQKTYDTLNGANKASPKNSVFMAISVKDNDKNDVLRGKFGFSYKGVRYPSGDIIWPNGTTTMSSTGGVVTGYGFIPIDNIKVLGTQLEDVKMFIEIFDGTSTVFNECSHTEGKHSIGCAGYIDVDFIKPQMKVDWGTEWVGAQGRTVTITPTDNKSSVEKIILSTPNGKEVVKDVVTGKTMSFQIESVSGVYSFNVMDSVGNTSTIEFNDTKFDLVNPTMPTILISKGAVSELELSGSTDAQSGLRHYLYKINESPWMVYNASKKPQVAIGDVVRARAVDMVYNNSEIVSKSILSSKILTGHGDITLLKDYDGGKMFEITSSGPAITSAILAGGTLTNHDFGEGIGSRRAINAPSNARAVLNMNDLGVGKDSNKLITSYTLEVPKGVESGYLVGISNIVMEFSGDKLKISNGTGGASQSVTKDIRDSVVTFTLELNVNGALTGSKVYVNGAEAITLNNSMGSLSVAGDTVVSLGVPSRCFMTDISVARVDNTGNSGNVWSFIGRGGMTKAETDGVQFEVCKNTKISKQGEVKTKTWNTITGRWVEGSFTIGGNKPTTGTAATTISPLKPKN